MKQLKPETLQLTIIIETSAAQKAVILLKHSIFWYTAKLPVWHPDWTDDKVTQMALEMAFADNMESLKAVEAKQKGK